MQILAVIGAASRPAYGRFKLFRVEKMRSYCSSCSFLLVRTGLSYSKTGRPVYAWSTIFLDEMMVLVD